MEPLWVLIADDRGLVVSRIAAQVESLGHVVIGVAKDGDAAEKSVARLHPDLVIVGLNIPPEDAIETTRAIFAIQPTPTILLTGYVSADLVRRGQEVGILAYLVWPADTSVLASTIRIALTRFRELRVIADQVGDSQEALRTSLAVERAKRMLVRRLDLSDGEAFQYLLRQSQVTATPVRDVATSLLSLGALLFGKPEMVECLATIVDVLDRREAVGPSQAA